MSDKDVHKAQDEQKAKEIEAAKNGTPFCIKCKVCGIQVANTKPALDFTIDHCRPQDNKGKTCGIISAIELVKRVSEKKQVPAVLKKPVALENITKILSEAIDASRNLAELAKQQEAEKEKLNQTASTTPLVEEEKMFDIEVPDPMVIHINKKGMVYHDKIKP